MKIKLILVLTFFICFKSYSQYQHTIDSLKNVYANAKHDTTRIKILNQGFGPLYEAINPDSAIMFYNRAISISDKAIKSSNSKTSYTLSSLKATSLTNIGSSYYFRGIYKKAITYYLKAVKLNEKIGNKPGMSDCYSNIGNVQADLGNFDKAILYYDKSLKIDTKLKNKKGMAYCFTNIGSVHSNIGNFEKAIDNFLKAVKTFEELDNKNGMAACYDNIGLIYRRQKSFDKAIYYNMIALKIYKELGNDRDLSACYINAGCTYQDHEDFKKALEFFFKALKIGKASDDKAVISLCYANIGLIKKETRHYDKAISYFKKALKILEEQGDKSNTSSLYCDIANLQVILADSASFTNRQKIDYLKKAEEYGLKAYYISKEINSTSNINKATGTLYRIYEAKGDYKKAIKFAKEFITTQDSLFNENKTKALVEMGEKYESEKKQLEVEKMQKQKELDNKTIEAQLAKNKKQLVIIFSTIIGFLIVLIFSIITFRMFRQKRKDNILLAKQKAEIEEKNRDILDSITYAKRIQSAILPPAKIVKEYLKDSFIIYKPKDIVAGDFYWMEHKKDKILFAACDCTGHGVPGAMVSVVCNNALNRSVKEHGLLEPGQILDKTKEIVVQEFEKSDDNVRDGMDIAICSLDSNKLQYAGANNPLYLVRHIEFASKSPEWWKDIRQVQNESMILYEIPPDKQPIGKTKATKPFTTHNIDILEGDCIYIFSDGFVDQFGGEKGKKFKANAFKELLLSIQNESMEEQRNIINQKFEDWKGDLEQVDDVCVIGMRT